MAKVTRTFTITADPVVMRRFERFLALLHFNSNFGHSGIFAMPLDGDGSEKIKVDEIDRSLGKEVGLLGDVGYDIEMAHDKSYSGYFTDKDRPRRYEVRPNQDGGAVLLREGKVHKTVPAYKTLSDE